MTEFKLPPLNISNCEEAVERNYYDWGRDMEEDPDPRKENWTAVPPGKPREIALRGYGLYDGWPPVLGNEIGALEAYVSVGVNSHVIVADVGRMLARADRARPLLARIPDHALLERANDEEIEAPVELIGLLCEAKHIGWGKATKVLHKKRPGFIPILDSVVTDFLWRAFRLKGGYSDENARTVLRLFQELLITHAEPLGEIRAALARKGFHLSAVRLLDYLIWLGWNSPAALADSSAAGG